jgi:multidrug resistance efflux pump
MIPGLKKRIAGVHLKDMEVQLADLEKGLNLLHTRRREFRQLAAQDLAPAQSLSQVEREIQIAEKQKLTLEQKFRLETEAFNEDQALLRENLGGTLKGVGTSESVRILAPISGQVIWIAPEMREDAELPPGTQAFMIGVMDSMIMRAQVHELEAVKISVGDPADVTLDSFPNRVFEARVSRISWAPLTPAVEQPTYYGLELTVANPDLELREGLKGQVMLHKQNGH